MKKATLRLLVIDIILLFILNLLPQTSANERKWSQMVANEQLNIVVNSNEQISSRSLDSKRAEKNEEISVESDILQSEALKISEEGINLIKKYEGLRLQSYKLPGEDNYTIGYGTSNASIKEGQEITEEEAEVLLYEEIEKVTKQVLNHCEYLNLTQRQADGLISFTYNTGYSNLKKLTNNGTRSIEEIAEHITAYTKSGSEVNRNGLKKRREEEKRFIIES